MRLGGLWAWEALQNSKLQASGGSPPPRVPGEAWEWAP